MAVHLAIVGLVDPQTREWFWWIADTSGRGFTVVGVALVAPVVFRGLDWRLGAVLGGQASAASQSRAQEGLDWPKKSTSGPECPRLETVGARRSEADLTHA